MFPNAFLQLAAVTEKTCEVPWGFKLATGRRRPRSLCRRLRPCILIWYQLVVNNGRIKWDNAGLRKGRADSSRRECPLSGFGIETE